MTKQALTCPLCGTKRIWKDGVRYTRNGDVQRYICRECGYRFSQTPPNNSNQSNKPDHDQTVHTNKSYRIKSYNIDRRVSVALAEGTKNLVKVETRTQKRAAGATTKLSRADVKGKVFQFAWWMKKEGYRESTIIQKTRMMRRLLKLGADILNPESVKEIIANQDTWNENTKLSYTNTYTTFLRRLGLTWKPPSYKETRKLPFIPTEKEIDQLIASCGKKTAAFLQLLKETAMRAGEAYNLGWIDIDLERRTITVTPEKRSNPRIFKVSNKLIDMLNALPRKSKNAFGDVLLGSIRATFCASRKIAAEKLKNPRLPEIHFHTFRHWKATTLYHQTKDVLYVMSFLGHKSVTNTMRYIQLEQALFNDDSDEFTSRVAKTVKAARLLIEAGFDYVCEFNGTKIFRKRK